MFEGQTAYSRDHSAMKYKPPIEITLTAEESVLYGRITFDVRRVGDEEMVDELAAMYELAQSLIARGAIPASRMDYFFDPAMNIGSSKSREEVFESNGTRGAAILRHPNFLKYLRYFINGPALSAATVQGFCQILNEDAGTSCMVMDHLRAFARAEVRRDKLDPGDAGEEFFKLAHELGRDPSQCRVVRDAACSVRLR